MSFRYEFFMQTHTYPTKPLRIGFISALAALTIASLVTLSVPAHASSNPGFVLYSAQGYDHASVTAFNATNPGFTVTLNDNSTGPLLEQIQAEGNNPKWGVLWVDGATAFAQLDNEGKLEKNSVPNVSFNALGKANVPADGSYTPTGPGTVTSARSATTRPRSRPVNCPRRGRSSKSRSSPAPSG